MKHKNLSWAQREANGKYRLRRLMAAELFSPKDMTIKKELARVRSEIRQRHASTEAKCRLIQ